MNYLIRDFLNRLPYIRGLYNELNEFKKNAHYPAGHYYSPIYNVNVIKKKEDRIWRSRKAEEIKGIDFNIEEQITLIGSLEAYYAMMPFSDHKIHGLRYYLDNSFYSYTDGIILYVMIRHLTPSKIIEVGSGFSSALIMDMNDRFFNNSMQVTFIDPDPERLNLLMNSSDHNKTNIIEKEIQDIDVSIFETMEAGDILFIDSSHVVKTGSDVNFILFEIIPLLKKGVYIHFHDIFYPFEYPKEWVYSGWNWNEDYFIRAFLMYNNSFKIKIFSHYLHIFHREVFSKMPLMYKNTGGSLWLEKK